MIALLSAALAEEWPTTEVGGAPAWASKSGDGTLAGGATHGVEEFRFRYYRARDELALFPGNPVLDYQEAVQRLALVGGNRRLSLGIQGDAVWLFSNAYKLDGVLTYERDLVAEGLWSPTHDLWFGIEKVWMEWRGGAVTLNLGDSYAAFGRGLALNLVKNSEIDVDTSLRGLKGVVTAGPFEITALVAGTNPQQVRLENPNVGMQPDLPHTVTGVDVNLYTRVNAGLHATAWQFARAYDPAGPDLGHLGRPVDAIIAGGNLKANGVGPFDFGFEGDWFEYDAREIPVDHGYAFYGSVAAYPGAVSILVEGKWYRDTEWVNLFTATEGYEVAAGPSLEYERAVTEDSSAALNSDDIKGGRARADLNLVAGKAMLAPYLSFAAFRDDDLGGVHFNNTPETIVHPVAGLSLGADEVHAIASAGWRADFRDRAPADNGGDTTLHADASISFPIAGSVSGELAPSFLRYHWGENPVQQADYTDFSGVVAVKVGSPWVFLLYADYTDNPLITSEGNLSEPWYGGAEVQWTPVASTTLKLFYGAYRAGIRCAGGQCRSLPGFEGAKFALTTNF